MNQVVDPITETDLLSYVDDQLSVARRIDVEAFLCRDPAAAVKVMADLRTRDELRLVLSGPPRIAHVATMAAARRLERGLSRDRIMRRFRRIAAVGLFVAAGWLAHAEFGHLGISQVAASTPPPAYVADAIRAHRTEGVRAAMRSQAGTATYDPADIRAAAAIEMPPLPKDWTVRDVQIFPSTYGPSVEMAIEAKDLGTVSLFAVRPGAFNVVPATLVREGDTAAAYWQIGEVAYALVAPAETKKLDKAAARLAASLY